MEVIDKTSPSTSESSLKLFLANAIIVVHKIMEEVKPDNVINSSGVEII